MPTDFFLTIDGIKGESSDAKHKDAIEVLSFRWGGSQPGHNGKSGVGISLGKVSLDDLAVTKTLDKASPPLYVAMCTGQHLKKVVLELCRATGDKHEYMEYKMEDVLVTRVNSSSTSREALPTEEITFTFGSIDWTYTELDHQSGKSKGKVTAGWDATANKKK